MAQSIYSKLLQLRRQRERAAHALMSECRNQAARSHAEFEEARADLERHRLLCRSREDGFRRKVVGKRVKSLTMELHRMDLESLEVQGELLANRLASRREQMEAADEALAHARTAWQAIRRDLERIEQLARRERLVQRRFEERVAEDGFEELATLSATSAVGPFR